MPTGRRTTAWASLLGSEMGKPRSFRDKKYVFFKATMIKNLMSAILLYCLTFLFFFLSMKIFFIFFLQQCLDVSLNWLLGFPGGSDDEESTCNAGDQGLLPGSGRSPGGRHSNPLQYSCLENPHGQRSLPDYSPRGRKELDTTEQLSTHTLNVLVSP